MLDGVDISTGITCRDEVRHAVGVVEQTANLMSGTVHDAIAYGFGSALDTAADASDDVALGMVEDCDARSTRLTLAEEARKTAQRDAVEKVRIPLSNARLVARFAAETPIYRPSSDSNLAQIS
jgi:ABC-type phosphate transport system ATPase subunit